MHGCFKYIVFWTRRCLPVQEKKPSNCFRKSEMFFRKNGRFLSAWVFMELFQIYRSLKSEIFTSLGNDKPETTIWTHDWKKNPFIFHKIRLNASIMGSSIHYGKKDSCTRSFISKIRKTSKWSWLILFESALRWERCWSFFDISFRSWEN